MAIYKTRWFDRWSRRQGIGDATLRRAAREMADGLHDADLGGGLFKKRVARLGQGKRGGFRTLAATNQKNRWVFVYGFAKNERGNIDATEAEALKKLAAHLLSLTAPALETARQAGELLEIDRDAKD